MTEQYCQSCGMPLGGTPEQYGTLADGAPATDYCSYCYQKGAFTNECTMEEMIAFCVAPMVEHNPDMSEAQARSMMEAFFPKLKRWQKV